VKMVEEHAGPMNSWPDTLLSAPMSDAGNAECLISLFGKDFRSSRGIATDSRSSKGVFHWSNHVWVEDTTRQFRDKAKWTARARGAIASQAETSDMRKNE
jgi:hypothetical protein